MSKERIEKANKEYMEMHSKYKWVKFADEMPPDTMETKDGFVVCLRSEKTGVVVYEYADREVGGELVYRTNGTAIFDDYNPLFWKAVAWMEIEPYKENDK